MYIGLAYISGVKAVESLQIYGISSLGRSVEDAELLLSTYGGLIDKDLFGINFWFCEEFVVKYLV